MTGVGHSKRLPQDRAEAAIEAFGGTVTRSVREIVRNHRQPIFNRLAKRFQRLVLQTSRCCQPLFQSHLR